MRSFSTIRGIYDAIFWLAVVALCWYFRDVYNLFINALTPLIGPFAIVAFIVSAIIAAFAVFYLHEAIAATANALYGHLSSEAPVDFDSSQQVALLRAAHKLEKRKDFMGAGEVYESLEAWGQAAECFYQAGDLSRSAVAWHKAGDAQRAVELYEADENFEAAAALATAEGMRDRAAKNHKAAAEQAYSDNRFAKSAELFERAHEFERAGRMYESLKRDADALRCYERGGATDRVEQILNRVIANPHIDVLDGSAELVRRSAELLAKSGKLIEAAQALEKSGDFVRAGEIYERAEAWDLAGEAFFRAEQMERADACYSHCVDTTKAADFRARVALQRGDWAEAGKQFVLANKHNQAVDAYKRGKEFVQAAKVYEDMGRFMLAGEMYSTGREFQSAGEAFAKAHDWRNAAECYETSGDLPQAIQAYVEAGNYYKAGLLDLKLGDSVRAVEHLQRVPPTSPDWRTATGHLATAFFHQKRYDMARELFAKVADQITPTTDTLSILYAYARLLEKEQSAGAISIYRRILGVNVNYEDVNERIAKLEQGIPVTGADFEEPEEMAFSATTVHTNSPTEARRPPGRRQVTQAPDARFGDQGRYAIIHELGRGGMAIVYKAFDQHLEREVALKTFPLSRTGLGKEEIFLREARLIARLTHPHIVTIYDSGHMDYLYYIAMEYVPGENLKQLVKRRGPMSLDEIRSVFEQLADALEYAHSQQVLHGDIKPGNVILRSTGDVKVVDFGLAKILTEAASRSRASDDSQSTLIGTPQYMAPEQILGGGVDCRTDIYALGLTLFYVLTGRTPFEVKRVTDPLEISRMQVNASFPVPSMLRATLPPKLDLIFVRCTQKNPAERYPNIEAFMSDFSKI